MLKQGAEDEIKRDKPVIERRREWEHGDGGDKDCWRKARPIFTAPEKVPDPCHRETCKNDEWRSKGIVLREKQSRKIVHREPVTT